MIKVLHVNDVPPMHAESPIKKLCKEAMEALSKNKGSVIAISRDDGRMVTSTAIKDYVPENVRVFQRGKQVYIKMEGI